MGRQLSTYTQHLSSERRRVPWTPAFSLWLCLLSQALPCTQATEHPDLQDWPPGADLQHHSGSRVTGNNLLQPLRGHASQKPRSFRVRPERSWRPGNNFTHRLWEAVVLFWIFIYLFILVQSHLPSNWKGSDSACHCVTGFCKLRRHCHSLLHPATSPIPISLLFFLPLFFFTRSLES